MYFNVCCAEHTMYVHKYRMCKSYTCMIEFDSGRRNKLLHNVNREHDFANLASSAILQINFDNEVWDINKQIRPSSVPNRGDEIRQSWIFVTCHEVLTTKYLLTSYRLVNRQG